MGGHLKQHNHVCCIARTDIMEEIEDITMAWEHALVITLREDIENEL